MVYLLIWIFRLEKLLEMPSKIALIWSFLKNFVSTISPDKNYLHTWLALNYINNWVDKDRSKQVKHSLDSPQHSPQWWVLKVFTDIVLHILTYLHDKETVFEIVGLILYIYYTWLRQDANFLR